MAAIAVRVARPAVFPEGAGMDGEEGVGCVAGEVRGGAGRGAPTKEGRVAVRDGGSGIPCGCGL